MASTRVLNGVIKSTYGPNRDRGEVQAGQGKYFLYYHQPGFAYGDEVTFSIDGKGYAVDIKLVAKYNEEQRTQFKIG